MLNESECKHSVWILSLRAIFLLQKELLAKCFNQHNSISELDALGDELLADEDNSYLDEAASAPAIPEVTPTDTKNKVSPLLFNSKIHFCLFWINHVCVGCWIFGILNILNKKLCLMFYVCYLCIICMDAKYREFESTVYWMLLIML